MSRVNLVSADWVEAHLDSSNFRFLDPRLPVRYMAGHPRGALNVPVTKARNQQGNLLASKELAEWLGGAGFGDHVTPVIYDSSDGRNAAMLAWILLHLGCVDVYLMETFWEKWAADGREVFYRPVRPVGKRFTPRVQPELRATLDQVRSGGGARLVDFRSQDEFTGKVDTEGRPGHIPGAVNVAWQELGSNQMLLARREKLESLFAAAGIEPSNDVVAYCRTGLRAALGFLALVRLGRKAALYDGSYAEWAGSGLPVEKDR